MKPLHVVAINQFYAPDRSATAQLLTELAEGLARRGHRVTVLASGERRDGPEVINGVHVVRVPATRLGKKSLATRALDYGSFYLGAMAALARLDTPADVFLPLTTPPLIALAPELVALWSRTPVVQLVQDLYPDVAVALGVVPRHGPLHRAWALATRASLRGAARVVALSEPMAAHLRRYGVPGSRVDVIPNWALAELEDEQATQQANRGAKARLEYGLGDRFVVMYSGNLGAGHQFETLCAAMRRLAPRKDIAFAIVGEGVRKAEVERFVAREQLDNVRFYPLAAREDLAESLAAADLHLITMRDGLDGLIVPSKLYGVLAASRPTLFIGPREDVVATTIRDAQCGLAFENGDLSGVVDAITRLAQDRAEARKMGERGRLHLERHLGRERALDAYEHTLQTACLAARLAPEPSAATQAPRAEPRARTEP